MLEPERPRSKNRTRGRPARARPAAASDAAERTRGLTRSDRLTQALEEMIFRGTLKPGAKLDEVALASEFGVSRTPVREAIQRLTAVGLVEQQARKGPVVTLLPVPRLVGMFEVMAEFDVIAARLAARRATEEERTALRRVLDRARAAVEDPAGYTQLNREFHWAIYAASHNDYLQALAIRTWKQLQPYRNFRLEQPERLRESLGQHEQLLEAILAYDAEGAARHMRNHVRLGGLIAEVILTLPRGRDG